jgi:hypothetical protein
MVTATIRINALVMKLIFLGTDEDPCLKELLNLRAPTASNATPNNMKLKPKTPKMVKYSLKAKKSNMTNASIANPSKISIKLNKSDVAGFALGMFKSKHSSIKKLITVKT